MNYCDYKIGGVFLYLESISLTNFRKFGSVDDGKPAITVEFNPNFNVLVGENDSGKTAIIDAIRYLLGSVSDDYEKIKEEDFYSENENVYSNFFYIEGTFSGISDQEAGAFLEWLSIDNDYNYKLRISLSVEKKKNDNGHEYLEKKVQAGDKAFESRLNNQVKELLKTTYLKPLRDASNELKPGFRSRLAHILKAHPAFKIEDMKDEHDLVLTMKEANSKIESFFKEEYVEGRTLVNDIERLLTDFHDVADQSKARSKFSVSKTNLSSILRRLSLDTEDINLGLGNLNLLFIAAELLLINDGSIEEIIGPRITLIEEIEAHLHTQSQIRLVKYIEEELEKSTNQNQYILTSHSSNLVASIDPKNVILLNESVAYPFREEYTELEDEDYAFLERFLDSTKSNLYFAKGIIFVEGESEMLLLPALAELLGQPLHKNGVTVVNVNGTSFERYIKLYSRSSKWRNEMERPAISKPLALITDIDIKPWSYYKYEGKKDFIYSINDENELEQVLEFCDEDKHTDIVRDDIGMEFTTLLKLSKSFGFEITTENEKHIRELVSKEVSERVIDDFISNKKERLWDKFSRYDANLIVNVAPQWTLEYSLALSVLAPYLLESIQEIRYKNPYKGKVNKKYIELKQRLMEHPEDPFIAYEVFKPVNDKLVSKAEVAQLLAIKIKNIKRKDPMLFEELKNKVSSDKYLEYLVRAINHSSNQNTVTEVSM